MASLPFLQTNVLVGGLGVTLYDTLQTGVRLAVTDRMYGVPPWFEVHTEVPRLIGLEIDGFSFSSFHDEGRIR